TAAGTLGSGADFHSSSRATHQHLDHPEAGFAPPGHKAGNCSPPAEKTLSDQADGSSPRFSASSSITERAPGPQQTDASPARRDALFDARAIGVAARAAYLSGETSGENDGQTHRRRMAQGLVRYREDRRAVR